MGTHGDIRTRFDVALNEAQKWSVMQKSRVEYRKFWDAYQSFVPGAAFPVNTKPGEVIRAPFGIDDGKLPQENITIMFNKAGYSVEDITFYEKGAYRGKTYGSNAYPSYVVKLKGDSKEYIVTSTTLTTDTGEKIEILKKRSNPLALGIDGIEYTNVDRLIKDISEGSEGIDSKDWNEDTKNYMKALMYAVKGETKQKFTDAEAFYKSGNISESINLDKYVKDIKQPDLMSMRNITNDFGEVLDGIYLLNVIKSKKEPLIFPNGSEALADIYMGNWAFSSKAKGIGGKPSIGYLSRVCYEFSISDTEFISEDKREIELFTILSDLGKNVNKTNSMPTIESYIIVANYLDKYGFMKGSAWSYFLKEAKLKPDTVTKNDIGKFLNNLANTNPKQFTKFTSNFFKLAGSVPTRDVLKEWTPEKYIEAGKNAPQPLDSPFYYTFSKSIEKILNKEYKKQLSLLINKFLVLKQIYFKIDIKKNTLTLDSESSNTVSNSKFFARGSSNKYNGGLGYKM